MTALAGTAPGKPKRPSRGALVAKIAASTYQGVSRAYVFDENHRIKGDDAYLYGVRDGHYAYLGAAPKATA